MAAVPMALGLPLIAALFFMDERCVLLAWRIIVENPALA
jgi:hypothetical protein